METNDREPQYLGTHRGIARVQIGWTTLYFRGDSYTHAIGSLYGTHETPTYQEIAAARKVIPVSPRPPVMANAPTERTGSRKAESRTKTKPGADEKKAPTPGEKPAPKPKPSAEKPPPATKAPAPAREPAKAKKATEAPKPRGLAPKQQPAEEPKPRSRKGKRSPVEAPIATMAELLAKVETTPAKLGAARDSGISSMAELEAQIA